MDLFNEIVKDSNQQIDSGVSSPQQEEESKYVPKNDPEKRNDHEICVSSDSEDDSGIQVLDELSKNEDEKSKKTNANLIDLSNVGSDDSECDSDIEHLPYFRRHKRVSLFKSQQIIRDSYYLLEFVKFESLFKFFIQIMNPST